MDSIDSPVAHQPLLSQQPQQEQEQPIGCNPDEMSCLGSTFHFIVLTIPILLLDGIQLLLYVLLLLPAFLQFGWFYISSGRISRRYKSESCRNTLDIFGHCPPSSPSLKPVILFCPGGAWLIGYKMWGALLAKVMIPFGVLVVIIDYRNYPLATVPIMVQDVRDAIQWSLDHVRDYGGNPTKVVLVGQSAGGHLCSVVLLRSAIIRGTFDPSALAGFVSLSSPFDLESMTKTFGKHGMSKSFTSRIFGDEMESYSPLALIRATPGIAEALPPMRIFHGTMDKTVPCQGSVDFARALRNAGLMSVEECVLYHGWSHTDPILEGVFDADHRFHRDLYELLQGWTGHDVAFDESHRACRRQCPRCLIVLARWVNPF